MSKEQSLVERLRELAEHPESRTFCSQWLNEAAVRIRFLEAQLHLKQDDWLEECKRVELLERQLALCKEQRNDAERALLYENDQSAFLNDRVLELDSDLEALERTGKHE